MEVSHQKLPIKSLLVDGDVILYRAAFSAEKTLYLEEKDGTYTKLVAWRDALHSSGVLWSRKEIASLEHSLAVVDSSLRHLRDKYPDLPPVIFLSPDRGNFRDQISTFAKYKGNRIREKPQYYEEVKEYLAGPKYKATVTEGQEADDALGIAATANPGSVICTIDKDLLQVPGRHYNWVTNEERTVSPKEGALHFWSQAISGDPADNIPGLSGFGPAKARKALAEAKSDADAWRITLGLYEERYGKDEGTCRATETARLVWVRRTEGQIWSPPEVQSD